MTAIGSVVVHDLPPYVMAQGDTAQAHGINSEGLRRRGFSNEAINGIRKAYKTIYRQKLTLEAARAELEHQVQHCPEVEPLLAFLSTTTRGIVR